MTARLTIRIVLGAIVVGALGLMLLRDRDAPRSAGLDSAGATADAPADRDAVVATCSRCHRFPPPESFRKADWKAEVAQGFQFLKAAGPSTATPSESSVVAYYEREAPAQLPPLERTPAPTPPPVRFGRRRIPDPDGRTNPAVAHVRFAHLFDDRKLDVVVCDMRGGRVLALRPYLAGDSPRLLSDSLHNPAHAEVVDLDRDGRRDILVADLGTFAPSDQRMGSVVLLRGRADGGFDAVPLAWGLGRVADAQAADFDGDGDLDVVVAVFGMHASGEILLLENRTDRPDRPVFLPKALDPRHGTIHVPVADLDGDGRPDFVALISQEHEAVVAFRNEGGLRFSQRVIYEAPHPAFGSIGIRLVDLDRDGDLDVLYTNGDVLDGRPQLRPDHGIRWLENRGGFPFADHRLASQYGVNRAEAADFDGDGDLDVIAVAHLPGDLFGADRRRLADAILLLEQTGPGRFARHALETTSVDYRTCDVGDFDGDGDADLVLGRFEGVDFGGARGDRANPADLVFLEENLGPAPPAPSRADTPGAPPENSQARTRR